MSLTRLKNNWNEHSKKLNAIIGDIILAIIAAILFGITGNLTPIVVGMMILFAVKPYLFNYINVIFKEDLDSANNTNLKLRKDLEYLRALAEYRVLLAAKTGEVPDVVMGSYDWNNANDDIEFYDELEILKKEVQAQSLLIKDMKRIEPERTKKVVKKG